MAHAISPSDQMRTRPIFSLLRRYFVLISACLFFERETLSDTPVHVSLYIAIDKHRFRSIFEIVSL